MNETSALPWTLDVPDASDIAAFVPGPGIVRLAERTFDLGLLRSALDQVLARVGFDDTFGEWGFGTLPITRRLGSAGLDPEDLSGRLWIRRDDTYTQVPRDEIVAAVLG